MNDNENKLIPASTVLIIRNGKIGIEVFMVVRNHEIDFASGALVFPGGKVDKNDYDEKLKNLSYIDEESNTENLPFKIFLKSWYPNIPGLRIFGFSVKSITVDSIPILDFPPSIEWTSTVEPRAASENAMGNS